MADLKIRDVSDHLVAFYKQRAQSKGVSLEEELRQTLAAEQRRVRLAVLADLRVHQENMRAKVGVLPESWPGIRAERDGEPDA